MPQPQLTNKTPGQDRFHAVQMDKREPRDRIQSFGEVALGFTIEQAMKEAQRCLTCANPQCSKGCPVGVEIPSFIKLIKEKKYADAIGKIKEKNSLPAICGRVCPQEEQCQKFCIMGKKGDPISIGRLERFVADLEREKSKRTPSWPPRKSSPTGKRVAMIGAGPAGLTAAAELAKLGHKVTIFEALHVAGGVLVYGIPEFRLPKKIVQEEVDYIKKLGVELHTDILIGRTFTIEELFNKGFDAVFIGSGAGLPQFLGIPGENLGGIYSANEFLIRVNLMKSYRFPQFDTPLKVGKNVAVIGAGNVAMDSARCALRLGAEHVCMIYRRSKEEIPARREELLNAEEEGITCKFRAAPTKFIGDEQGRVKGIEVIAMELGEPDETGRRKPLPIKGSEVIMDVDTVIVAIGRTPNPIIQSVTKGLQTTKHGTIIADPETGKTSLEGVYTGGDIMTGEATVISAMGSGKRAAKAINEYLLNKKETPQLIDTLSCECPNQNKEATK
jgi:glutamate synthase (NADPH) small chain